MDTPKAQKNEPKTTSWNLRNLAGTQAGVNSAIMDSDVPELWRSTIATHAASLMSGGRNFIYVDAHLQSIEKEGQRDDIMHLHFTSDKKLL